MKMKSNKLKQYTCKGFEIYVPSQSSSLRASEVGVNMAKNTAKEIYKICVSIIISLSLPFSIKRYEKYINYLKS